jgi:hypothetical protein
MSHDLYKLHMMAYEIEVLNAQLMAEVITQAEYDEKMKQYECHHEICVEEHDEECAACYRDIINSNFNILRHKE